MCGSSVRLVAALSAAGLAVCVSNTSHGAIVTVNMLEMTFSVNGPGEPTVWPTINVGDTIRWLNVEGIHTTQSVAGQAESWDSGFMFDVGDTFERQFNNPGTFTYFCLIHGGDNGDGTANGMQGTITVVPAPGAAALAGLAGLWAARRRRPMGD